MNEFIIDAMVDRLWEIAQGRFGARSMRAVLENPVTSLSQQRRVATAVILNSIPLATNPNGAILLTWLLDASGFHSRYRLLAPRFAPHLSHLCTHKLASLTVLRIVNQKSEPEASAEIVNALFFSPGDQVLTDILGDQVNGVAVIYKILTSQFIDQSQKPAFIEATKRVLHELKVVSVQAYRRLLEEVGLPVPQFSGNYPSMPTKKPAQPQNPSPNNSYPGEQPTLAAMMAALQMQSVGLPLNQSPQLQVNPNYQGSNMNNMHLQSPSMMTPGGDGFGNQHGHRGPRRGVMNGNAMQSPSQAANQSGMGMMGAASPSQFAHPQAYQQYVYQQMYQQQPQQNAGSFHI